MGCLKVSKVDATKKLQWPDVRLVHEEAQIIARFVHITAELTTNLYFHTFYNQMTRSDVCTEVVFEIILFFEIFQTFLTALFARLAMLRFNMFVHSVVCVCFEFASKIVLHIGLAMLQSNMLVKSMLLDCLDVTMITALNFELAVV